MKDMLAGKTALITGGTSGIGEATVELFVEEGANVVFTGRDEEKGANVQERCGGNALFFKANVLHEEQIKAAVDYTVEMFERIDILFNNAGAPVEGGIENMTSEKLHYATDLLVGSVMHATKYAVPHMKKHGFGRIINNSSIAAHGTHHGRYIYSAAKAAVSHLTRVAGMELGRHGITVNAISPGTIISPIFIRDSLPPEGITPEHHQAKLNKLAKKWAHKSPMMHVGELRDIAYAALYLASQMGAFVNCQDLVVDGGTTAAGRTDFSEEYSAG